MSNEGKLFLVLCLGVKLLSCTGTAFRPAENNAWPGIPAKIAVTDSVVYYITVSRDIPVREYFLYMDSLVARNDTFSGWHINEYILVHANPWILDSLCAFDYYRAMQYGRFIYDQGALAILRRGDSLAVPDSLHAAAIAEKLASTVIDVNIPEFTLRLLQSGDTILVCPVRVGRNEKEYLAVAGRKVNLRTPVGTGEIIRIARMPDYVNPRTGKKYDRTRRDDQEYTKMPVIPWLEPSINGIRYGSMIHPTTNPETLGKAYSHGCVGTREADAWIIYYNAPVGTRVVFRYDLTVTGPKGDTIHLHDIYHRY